MVSQHSPDLPPFLSAGSLVLATGSQVLTGPFCSMRIMRSVYRLLVPLMRQPGQVVPVPRLLAALYDAKEPADPERALVMRVNRARDVLELVGVDRDQLHCHKLDGYSIDGGPAVVRSFSLAQAAALDAVLASHPDRALVAKVAA